jgi:hypothetical protein
MTRFVQILNTIGNINAQALQLNIPIRTLQDYRAGRFPQVITRLQQEPALLRALADDAEQGAEELEVAA